jgi:hypothetical protein
MADRKIEDRKMRCTWRQGEPGLKPGEAKAANNPIGDRPPAFRGDTATAFYEFGLGRRMDYVAFAERFPIQTVSFVQNDFVHLGLAGGPLRRAKLNADARLKPHPLIRAQDYAPCWSHRILQPTCYARHASSVLISARRVRYE